MGELVKVESADGVHRITLNRPEMINALNRDLRRELTAALLAGHSARVIVLTGAGRGFCSGQDLTDASGLDDAGFEATLNGEYVPMIRAITARTSQEARRSNGARPSRSETGKAGSRTGACSTAARRGSRATIPRASARACSSFSAR